MESGREKGSSSSLPPLIVMQEAEASMDPTSRTEVTATMLQGEKTVQVGEVRRGDPTKNNTHLTVTRRERGQAKMPGGDATWQNEETYLNTTATSPEDNAGRAGRNALYVSDRVGSLEGLLTVGTRPGLEDLAEQVQLPWRESNSVAQIGARPTECHSQLKT
eukprot:c8208_g1_i1 orf=112-597(-)